MIKSADLIAAIATEAALPLDVVSLHARRLREAGLFVKETRSPQSPRVQPRHVANLLFMLLSEQPAAFAGKTIERAAELAINPDGLKETEQLTAWPEYGKVYGDPEHSFLDVLECLIEVATKRPHWFDEGRDAVFAGTYVSFSRQEFIGEVHFEALNSVGESECEFFAMYSDGVGDVGASRNFRQSNTIYAGLFAAIGRALARGAQ